MRVAFVLSVLLLASPVGAENLLVVGFDGVGRGPFEQMLDADRLPGIQRLLQEGGVLIPIDLEVRTDTGASWTAAFTGRPYYHTGMFGRRGNSAFCPHYDPDSGTYRCADGYLADVLHELTLWSVLQDEGYAFGMFITKEMPWFAPTTAAAESFLVNLPAGNGCHPGEYQQPVVDEALTFVATYYPFAVFLHFDPDRCGHVEGSGSKAMEDDIIASDDFLLQVLDAVPEGTVVWVMADHGFDDTSDGGDPKRHLNAPRAWAVTNVAVKAEFTTRTPRVFAGVMDVAPTLLDALGVDWKALRPTIRGHSLLEPE